MQIFICFAFALTLAELVLAVTHNELCNADPWLDGKITNPAAKLRLNSNGIDLAQSLASKNLTNFIKSIRAPDVQVYDITVFNVHVTRFENANFYRKLVRPNVIQWGFNKAQLAVISGFKRKVRILPSQEWQTIEANVTVASASVSMETVTSMFKDGDGRPIISSTSCIAKLNSPTATAYGDKSLTSLLEANKLLVINEIERMFYRLVCGTTSFVMKDNINKVLKTYPSKVKLGGINSLLVLDNSLTFNPDVVNKETAIEGMLKGSVYYRYPSFIPFYPPAISETDNNKYMLDFYATDYVFNSLLFTAFKEKLFKFEATSKTLSQSVGNYLALSCSAGSVCVGNLFPNASSAVGDDAYVRVCMHATKSPKTTFINGDAYWSAQAALKLEIVERNKTTTLFSSSSPCIFGSLVPKIDKSTVYATIKVASMPFDNVVSPTKDLSLDEIKKMQSFFIAMTEEIVNGILSIGFPLPLVDGVSLVNPSVKLLPRTLYVGSNFTYTGL